LANTEYTRQQVNSFLKSKTIFLLLSTYIIYRLLIGMLDFWFKKYEINVILINKKKYIILYVFKKDCPKGELGKITALKF